MSYSDWQRSSGTGRSGSRSFVGPTSDADDAAYAAWLAAQPQAARPARPSIPRNPFTPAARPTVEETAQAKAIWDCLATDTCNVVVEARAGSGKTTTIVEGLYRLPSRNRVAFVAFNRSIANELKGRVPQGVLAATFHSLGGNATAKWLNRKLDDTFVMSDKVQKLILPPDMDRDMKSSIAKLVEQCKNQLIDPRNTDALLDLAAEHDIDLGDYPRELLDWVPETFDRSLTHLDHIDYGDMIYMALRLCPSSVPKFDHLFVDEAQDLSPARQQLALLAGDRVTVVGDHLQAIYAFAGADSRSMDTMRAALDTHNGRGVKVFPLSQTRRCPKIVVALARSVAPDLEALPVAPEGVACLGESWAKLNQCACGGHKHRLPEDDSITCATCGCFVDPNGPVSYRLQAKTDAELDVFCEPQRGDGVLCRVNKDLVTLAYAYIRRGIPVKIQGRDIGSGLKTMIRRLVRDGDSTVRLVEKITTYRDKETTKILAANGGDRAEAKLEALNDKVECILALSEGLDTVSDVLARIDVLFEDVKKENAAGVVHLSSIHKAKGLEWNTVYVIRPDLIPHPMAKTPEAQEQETHLKYVAQTRSKGTLHWHDLV